MIQSRLRTVKVDDLKVPTEYHEGVDPGALDRLSSAIQQATDPDDFADWVRSIAVVERSDGDLYVVDGVQRVAAMRQIGIEEINVMVLTGLTLEDEASLFATRNSGTKLV